MQHLACNNKFKLNLNLFHDKLAQGLPVALISEKKFGRFVWFYGFEYGFNLSVYNAPKWPDTF